MSSNVRSENSLLETTEKAGAGTRKISFMKHETKTYNRKFLGRVAKNTAKGLARAKAEKLKALGDAETSHQRDEDEA